MKSLNSIRGSTSRWYRTLFTLTVTVCFAIGVLPDAIFCPGSGFGAPADYSVVLQRRYRDRLRVGGAASIAGAFDGGREHPFGQHFDQIAAVGRVGMEVGCRDKLSIASICHRDRYIRFRFER